MEDEEQQQPLAAVPDDEAPPDLGIPVTESDLIGPGPVPTAIRVPPAVQGQGPAGPIGLIPVAFNTPLGWQTYYLIPDVADWLIAKLESRSADAKQLALRASSGLILPHLAGPNGGPKLPEHD